MLALEVVEAGAAEVARLQRGDERVGVVQQRAGRVDVDRARLHRRELRRAHEPLGLGRDHRVHRHDVALGEHLVEVVGVWCVASGLYGSNESTRMPRPSKRHFAARPTAPSPTMPTVRPRELPGAVALVGDLAARVDLAGAHVVVGGHDATGSPRTCSAIVISATASALRPGARSTGIPALVAASMSTLLGSPRHEPMQHERQVEHRALHRVGLDDEDVGALLARCGPRASRRCSSRSGTCSIHGSYTTSANALSVSQPSPRNGAVTSALCRSVTPHPRTWLTQTSGSGSSK